MPQKVVCFFAGYDKKLSLVHQKGQDTSAPRSGYECEVEPGASIETAIANELWRIANAAVFPGHVQQCARIRTYDRSGQLQDEVQVFKIAHWLQGPSETEYYASPVWLGGHRAMFEEVSDTGLVWIPPILEGVRFDAEIRYPLSQSSYADVIFKDRTF